MTLPALGRLEQVELRDVWPSESGNFTPWLAQEGNLSLLADTIGLDLELVAVERAVGPFRADIVCKDTVSGAHVLIENQIEWTDHTHLGQLLTYAAGLSAVTIVWIARRFTEEHRAALDWLNESTTENIDFFGLEIELWRIGHSDVAPKFNIVSQPNDWVKGGGVIIAGELTATQQLQLEYWKAFQALVAEQSKLIRPRKPSPQHWCDFALGRSNVYLQAAIDSQKKLLSAGIAMDGPYNKSFYHQLYAQRQEIEKGLGGQVTWWELPEKKSSYVSIYRPDSPLGDRDTWPAQHDWLLQKLELLHRVFAIRAKNLLAVPYDPDPAYATESEAQVGIAEPEPFDGEVGGPL